MNKFKIDFNNFFSHSVTIILPIDSIIKFYLKTTITTRFFLLIWIREEKLVKYKHQIINFKVYT